MTNSEPRIVTPQEAATALTWPQSSAGDMFVARLIYTVATEPDRIRAAVQAIEEAYEVLYADLEEALAAIARVRAVMFDAATAWAPNNADALSVSMGLEPISVGPMMVDRSALEVALATPERMGEDRTRTAVVKALRDVASTNQTAYSAVGLRERAKEIENGADY